MRYSPELKALAVERVRNGESRRSVAKDLGCSQVTIGNWTKDLPGAHLAQRLPLNVKEEALVMLAQYPPKRAHEELAKAGVQISLTAVKRLNTEENDRIAHLRESLLPEIHHAIASRLEDVAERAAEVALRGVEAAERQIAEGSVRDAAAAAKHVATVAGIASQNLSLLRNRPTQIVEHRNAEEIMRKLASLGVHIEGQAEETS